MKRFISLIVVAVVAALALSACGGSSSSGSTSSSSFNNADVTFAQSMIPHHEQAVRMAKFAKTNASSPAVKELAAKIEAAQGPEIATMSGWLKDWGKDGKSGSGMNGMDMDSMPGMMSDDEMMTLDGSSGAMFDRMFLTMMIEHHTGAIEMAKTEKSDGENSDAIALAKKIEADQAAEIAAMKDLLKS
ncbi:MAG: DUF305 domain-containing protein [Sporichthyaceae bacterium]